MPYEKVLDYIVNGAIVHRAKKVVMGARQADRSTRDKQMTSSVYVDSDTNVLKGADLKHLFTRGRRAEISHYLYP